MLITAITVKLAVDFFEFLRKNAINATDIKLGFFDRNRTRYRNFANLDELRTFYVQNYGIFDKCQLGEFASVESFKAESRLYTFGTYYIVTDVCNNTKIIPGYDFDRTRVNTREVFRERQLTRLNSLITDYNVYCREIRGIYTTGIYSPCYAEPGWSEGTARLEELRRLFINTEKAFS